MPLTIAVSRQLLRSYNYRNFIILRSAFKKEQLQEEFSSPPTPAVPSPPLVTNLVVKPEVRGFLS